MSIKTKWKRNLILMMAIFAIMVSMLSPALTTLASFEEAQKNFDEQSSEFIKDADEAADILELLEDDAKANPKPKRNSISYVMRRLLYPGEYVNDVRDGVLARSIIKSKDEILYDGKYACNPNAPNNLINHNCNIPNFTTGLIQNISEPLISPFNNAEKTSSYSVFGLGVPDDIPGGVVPINPGERNHSYTALELFGYNLQLTSYNGEWDQIVVSTSARMLSNFGVIDQITLVGTTLWNSTKEGVAAFIENFSFNPARWFGTAARAYEAAASTGVNTIVDTSELNVVATNEWKRPNLDKTLYNIYVLTDKEILQETARNYFSVFSKELDKKASDSEELAAVLARDPSKALKGLEFTYDPKMETEESKQARETAQAQRDSEISQNENEKYLEELYQDSQDIDYIPDLVEPLTEVPEPVYYTESEQLGIWESGNSEVQAVLSDVRGEGLISGGSASHYETYEEMMNEWQESYSPYFLEKFNASGETVQEILKDTDASVFQEHPHLDPKQGISRYACAKSDGSIMRKSNGTVEYLYTDNNNKSTEYLNSNCSQARPPIGGGLLGTGWSNPVIDDTRHISNVSDDSFLVSKLANIFTSVIRSLNSITAKVTNIILGLSFTPLLDQLGINTIVAKLIESFRDTVFFPLAGLVVTIGALMLFFQLLKDRNAWQLLTSIVMTFFIFIVGAAFLLHPTATLKVVDEFPSKMDNFMADTILGSGDGSKYCSTGEDQNGVRSAQCSVWGAMVFEPWVHLQFGTGYENLYANGKAPSGGNEMTNKNTELVGDAAVDMGGGEIVNNWAMYQLSKTKSGTINQHDNRARMGNVDKDMYRLVDLQAGPDNGAASDNRHFDSWSGNSGKGPVLILTLIQALLMALAIGLLGLAKIEVSFMFSISILFLPFMLLYALTEKGRARFKSYIANLISLLIKRAVIVVMIAVLLRVIIAGYSKASSLEMGAFIAIAISVAFILYRKELLNMITATEKGLMNGDTENVKEALGKIVPKGVKQGLNVTKAKVKGQAAGFIGGAVGAAEHKAEIRLRRAGIAVSLAQLEMKGNLSDADIEKREALKEDLEDTNSILRGSKKISSKKAESLEEKMMEDLRLINQYEDEANKINEKARNNNEEIDIEELSRINNLIEKHERSASKKEKLLRDGGKGTGIIDQALKGSVHSKGIIGRQAERKIRAEGYAPVSSYREVKRTVHAEGAEKITSLEEEVAHDVYREILSHSMSNKSKSSRSGIEDKEKGQLEKYPKIQRKVREIARERKEMAEREDYSAITPDMSEIEKAARIVDRRRGLNRATKGSVHKIKEEFIDKRESAHLQSSKVEHMKTLIEKDIGEGVKPDKIIEKKDKDGKVISTEVIYHDREKSEDNKSKLEKKMKNKKIEEIESERDKIQREKEAMQFKDQASREKERLERIVELTDKKEEDEQ